MTLYIPKRAGTWTATVTFRDQSGVEIDVSQATLVAVLRASRPTGVVVRSLSASAGTALGSVVVVDANGTTSWPELDLFLEVSATIGGTRYVVLPSVPLRLSCGTSHHGTVEVLDGYLGSGRSSVSEVASVWRWAVPAASTGRQVLTVTTSTATLPSADALVTVNVTAGVAVTLTLPAAAAGRRYDIVEIYSAGITLARSAGVLVNNVNANFLAPGFVGTYRMLSVVCDGTAWWVFSEATA